MVIPVKRAAPDPVPGSRKNIFRAAAAPLTRAVDAVEPEPPLSEAIIVTGR